MQGLADRDLFLLPILEKWGGGAATRAALVGDGGATSPSESDPSVADVVLRTCRATSPSQRDREEEEREASNVRRH
jgi:hypothetical protein